MIAVEKQDLRHDGEAPAQRQLDQQRPIRANVIGHECGVLQCLLADQAENVRTGSRPQPRRGALDGAGRALPNAVLKPSRLVVGVDDLDQGLANGFTPAERRGRPAAGGSSDGSGRRAPPT